MAKNEPSFYSLLPGDGLDNEIRSYFNDPLEIDVNLKMAEELSDYNSRYDESLNFGEYVKAYHHRFFEGDTPLKEEEEYENEEWAKKDSE